MDLFIKPSQLQGSVRPPVSKSIAHRALILSYLAHDPSELVFSYLQRDVHGLVSDDIVHTHQGLAALLSACEAGAEQKITAGAQVCSEVSQNSKPNAAQSREAACEIFCGQSASTLRFLIPIAAILGVAATFTGDESLLKRPVDQYHKIFADTPVQFRSDAHHCSVLGRLSAGNYRVSSSVSSQFISGLLMALGHCKGASTVTVEGPILSRPYIDLTINVMKTYGVQVTERVADADSVTSENQRGSITFEIPGGGYCISQVDQTDPQDASIEHTPSEFLFGLERDWSSASYWFAARSLGADIIVDGMDPTSLQGDKTAPALFQQLLAGQSSTEIPATQRISLAQTPDLISILAVVASCAAPGQKTIFTDIERLSAKESDRVASTKELITALGGTAYCQDNALVVEGDSQLRGGIVDCKQDHRIAMAAAIAALYSQTGALLVGAECVSKSYPGFFSDLVACGGQIQELSSSVVGQEREFIGGGVSDTLLWRAHAGTGDNAPAAPSQQRREATAGSAPATPPYNSSTWQGKALTLTASGGSHAEAVTVEVAGLPQGATISTPLVMHQLQRRRPGGSLVSPRKEADTPICLSGITEDQDPQTEHACYHLEDQRIRVSFLNTNKRSKDYGNLAYTPRTAHADFSAYLQGTTPDDLVGGSLFSGRMTLAHAFAGALCKDLLQAQGIYVGAYVSSVGQVTGAEINPSYQPHAQQTISQLKSLKELAYPINFIADMTDNYQEDNPPDSTGGMPQAQQLRNTAGLTSNASGDIRQDGTQTVRYSWDQQSQAAFEQEIQSVRAQKDSVGAVVTCCIWCDEPLSPNALSGLGGPLFDGIESTLSQLIFSIPGVKGVSYGDGFELAQGRGSQVGDKIMSPQPGKFAFERNSMGGILGGITNGMIMTVRVAFKPTPSHGHQQETVYMQTGEARSLIVEGRHDPCIALRALPAVEGACALALYDIIRSNESASGARKQR